MNRLLILLLVIPFLGNGQSNSVLPVLLATSSSQNISASESQLHGFIQRLKAKKSVSEIVFLKRIFRQTQKTFLTKYVAYSDFYELFTTGKFDCLTATSLFSVVLSQLSFNYRIVETNYHIFIMVETSEGEILLETTDRLNGFVTSSDEIRSRIGNYRSIFSSNSLDNKIYQYHFDLYHEVNPNQLAGLLYYNQAVKAYNNGNLEKCADLLTKAQAAYETPRIAEFSSVFLQSVTRSKLDNQTKQRIVEQLKNLTAQRAAVLASR